MAEAKSLVELLADSPFVVLDGAMATELERRGCDLADPLWSAKVLLEHPELIRAVHLDYFRAGAQVAITASYQATPEGFAVKGIGRQKALALIAQSVHLARQARSDYRLENPNAGPLFVAGSVGPYGAYLADGSEYRGDYILTPEKYVAFHQPRIDVLLDAGADLLACETLPNFLEIQTLALLLARYPEAQAWFSFTLRDPFHLSDGTPLSRVVEVLAEIPQVIGVGINCVALAGSTSMLECLHGITGLPLVVYPNSGEQYDAGSKTWHAAAGGCGAPAAHLPQWLESGAKLIGGCCRTTPADISALSAYQEACETK